ncbi:hypothetical protein LTR78_004266 [Recurvomyces mirabilis]|uniref:Uncharacterized protein n=1 Tax=Recurvomyces mirabilis TaxID=574656 RepID=A0AAE0WQR4_9PEZI|nr:hypothetical protein LTR78_004266 [Recurvomyces mirabilis]KAK5153563.1 hypothetical protein LTS14_007257 [Recurvomyces mirabilis]
MISTELRLTWVQSVRPDLLGSHLEAYIKLIPTFNMLRLCARHGKGKAVTVNRLPTELVSQIEAELLAQEHYGNDIPVWGKSAFCFRGFCDPIDHLYSEQDLVRLYGHYFYDATIDETQASSAKLNEDKRADLNQVTMEDDGLDDEILPGIQSWRAIHEESRSLWLSLTGGISDSDSGYLQSLNKMFRQLFGLDLSVSHQTFKAKWLHEDFKSGTQAFIMLPTSAQTSQCLPERLAGEQITVKLPTEHTTSFCVAPPPQSTKKSMARFTRCLKILQLEPLPLLMRQDLVHGRKMRDQNHGAEDDDQSSDASKSPSSSKDQEEDEELGPALRLIMVTRDDSQYCSED